MTEQSGDKAGQFLAYFYYPDSVSSSTSPMEEAADPNPAQSEFESQVEYPLRAYAQVPCGGQARRITNMYYHRDLGIIGFSGSSEGDVLCSLQMEFDETNFGWGKVFLDDEMVQEQADHRYASTAWTVGSFSGVVSGSAGSAGTITISYGTPPVTPGDAYVPGPALGALSRVADATVHILDRLSDVIECTVDKLYRFLAK